MRAFVQEHGYVENMFGFRRPLGQTSLDFDLGNDGDDNEFESDGGGGAFWGNQAINTPIQGAAHCLMLMAMAIMKRKPKKYKKLLKAITLEIHDYIGFKCPLRDLQNMFALAKPLLEKEPLKLIEKEYPDIKWTIPLQVEGVSGLRYGDSIEAEGKQLHEIMLAMFLETYAKEVRLDHELKLAA